MKRTHRQLDLFAPSRKPRNMRQKPHGEKIPTEREFRAAMALYAPPADTDTAAELRAGRIALGTEQAEAAE